MMVLVVYLMFQNKLKVDPGSFCTQSVRKTDLKRIKNRTKII